MIAELLGISEIVEKELRRYPEFFLKRLKVSGLIIKDEFDLLKVSGLYWQHEQQVKVHLQQIFHLRQVYWIIKEKYGSDFFLSDSPIVNTFYDMLNGLPFSSELMYSNLSASQLKTELAKMFSLVPFGLSVKTARKSSYKRFKKKTMSRIQFENFSLSEANFSQFLKVSQMLREAQQENRDGKAGNGKTAYVLKLEKRFDELVQKFGTENNVVVAPFQKNGV